MVDLWSSELMSARAQISREKFQELHKRRETPGTIFNVWHLQESGGDSHKYAGKKVLSPCHWTAQDIGTTTAPDNLGRFCMWFSRGMCTYGPDCRNLHRLPGARDEPFLNPALDCFGREKHAGYRDDMRGVGSFMHENKSIMATNLEQVPDLEKVVRGRFAPFGTVTSVTTGKFSATITYEYESQAQFAKEAMAFQPLVKGSKRGMLIQWAQPVNTSQEDALRVQQALLEREERKNNDDSRENIAHEQVGA